MRKAVGRGATATAISQGLQIATQTASVLVLSRLLSPSDFGLVAMCAPVIALLGMLQNFGLVQATVQKKHLLNAEVNLLFWVNVAFSVFLALILAMSAPLIAAFYGDPRITLLLVALSSTIVISGLGAQHNALLNRQMAFGKLAWISVTGAVITLFLSIGWAMISPSYWALFAGTLGGAIAATILTWLWSGWLPGKPARASGMRELLGFGAGLTGFNLTNFLARNVDNVLIGKVWGSQQLGFYDRAYKLLIFPLNQISNPLSRVMIPALSRMTDEPDRYRSAYLRVLNLSLIVVLPGVAWATASANVLIPFLLGPQWQASASIFMALGFAGLVQPLNNPAGWLFISQGRSTEYMKWGFVTAAFALTAFGIGIFWGAMGVAIAYSISEYVKTVPLWLFISRKGPVRARDIFRTAGPTVLGAHIALFTTFAINLNSNLQTVIYLPLTLACAYFVQLLILLLFQSGRDILLETLSIVRGSILNFKA